MDPNPSNFSYHRPWRFQPSTPLCDRAEEDNFFLPFLLRPPPPTTKLQRVSPPHIVGLLDWTGPCLDAPSSSANLYRCSTVEISTSCLLFNIYFPSSARQAIYTVSLAFTHPGFLRRDHVLTNTDRSSLYDSTVHCFMLLRLITVPTPTQWLSVANHPLEIGMPTNEAERRPLDPSTPSLNTNRAPSLPLALPRIEYLRMTVKMDKICADGGLRLPCGSIQSDR